MIQIPEIQAKIEAINELLSWHKHNKTDLYEQRFVQLVQERCQLRTIMETKKENPAIAAYGESQKGKSYLMGNLLQKNGKPFMISLPSGEKINFVRSINPIGDLREATGVVTRFTAFQGKNAERYSDQYPVLMKLLTVSDIATILSDSYYNDLRDPRHYTDEEIKEKGNSIYEKYKDCPEIKDTHLVEDDIIDIKNYVLQYMKSKATSLVNGANSAIFDKVALVIRRVPQSEWSQVLEFLWHENPVLTKLFNRLVGAMSRLGFPREVYLPIDAVRHHGINENTIMSVACLNGIDKPGFDRKSDVYIREGGKYTKVPDFNKAELCAICAETAYRVDQEYLSTKVSYCLDMLPEETKSKLKSNEIDKDVINVADLLDFPGARNRESIAENNLSDYDEKEGASNTVKAFLRGKVAYLFNKYCASRSINILMFCHDQMNYSVTMMPVVIDNWVKSYVGRTTEERQKTVSGLQGISPLFVISTKFNMDMTLKQDNINIEQNSVAAVNERWNGRFKDVLYRDCLQAHSVEWFNNWVRVGETFKNTYLLRDYKFSTCSGEASSLYEGYVEDADNPKEERLHLPQEFYGRLRDTFVNNDTVGKFFEDPAFSWDLAATLNNDGALYIIERLRTVAYNMDTIRDRQFEDEVRECMSRVYKLMENDYEPEDDNENIRKDIKAATGIMREMDHSCQVDMYFFGHLIQTLQLDHTLAYNAVDDFVNNYDPGNPGDTAYQLIRKRCHNFEGCKSHDEKMQLYMKTYICDTVEEAEEDMRRRGIDKEKLFRDEEVRQNNSALVAQRVYKIWTKQLLSSDLFNRLLIGSYHDEAALSALTARLVANAERLHLADHLADEVSKYLDIVNIHNTNIDMVSDIITNGINQFVCDMGYSLLTQEQLDNAKTIAQQNGVVIDAYIGKGIEPLPQEELISDLFTKMMKKNDDLTRTFEQNYYEWIEFMFISFLNGNARIIENPEANRKLGMILKKIK